MARSAREAAVDGVEHLTAFDFARRELLAGGAKPVATPIFLAEARTEQPYFAPRGCGSSRSYSPVTEA